MCLLLPSLMVTANSPTETPMAGHSTYPTKASKIAGKIDRILDKELGRLVKKRSADLPNIHSLSGGFYGKFEPHYSHPSSLHQPTSTYQKPTPVYPSPPTTYHKPRQEYHTPTPSVYHEPTPAYKPAPSYHSFEKYQSEPSYHPNPHPPSYHQPKYEEATANCTVIEKKETGEVCTPTLDTKCEDVKLTYKKIIMNKKCNTITTTKCKEVNEEEEVEICSYHFTREKFDAKGKTVDVTFEKKEKKKYEEVCEKVQVYGKYEKEYEEKCKKVPKITSYNIPKVTELEVDLTLYAPEPTKTCIYKRVVLPRVVCEDEKKEKCQMQPDLMDAEETLQVCKVRKGEPDCKRIELGLPEQHCEDIILKPKYSLKPKYHGQ